MKALFNSFYLNGHTLGFQPQTENPQKNYVEPYNK